MEREVLDEFIKIVLKKEIDLSLNDNIAPTVDHLSLSIVSNYNILNSGILGLSFQKKEQGILSTIKNSILRICEEDTSIIENVKAQFILLNDKQNFDYFIITKLNEFSKSNELLLRICKEKNVPIIFYDKLSFVELSKIKNNGFKNAFIATNFTPYGMKERKVINDKLQGFDISSVSFLLNKSQCIDLNSIHMSLKNKIRHRDFFKEFGDDLFYLDQLSERFLKDEVGKIKKLC